ncbi:hypothetical protein ACSVBT_18060 [Afipia sp. TerB]
MTTVCAEAGTAMQSVAAAAIAKAIFFIRPPPEQIRAIDAHDNVPRPHPFRRNARQTGNSFPSIAERNRREPNLFVTLCANDHKEVLRSVIERWY